MQFIYEKKNNFYKINSFYRAKLFEIECGELSKGTDHVYFDISTIIEISKQLF